MHAMYVIKNCFHGTMENILYFSRKQLPKNFLFMIYATISFFRNYFWSDSRPEGFGFELCVVAPGDKFTVIDAHHNRIANCEIICNKVSITNLTLTYGAL